MKKGLYLHLGVDSIRKNKRLYLPYFLSAVGVIAIFYLLAFLENNPNLSKMVGGTALGSILEFGTWIIGFFAVLFLFYTNSFLMKQRKKEFGLYSVLGMGKGNLTRVLFWEMTLIAIGSIGGGLFLGCLLSKAAELGLVRLMKGAVSYRLSLPGEAVLKTALFFAVLFFLLFLNAIRQLHFSTAVSLLQSQSAGEKPPKGNWVLGLAGVAILGGAYYLAVSIEDPISAVSKFFIASLMVILGTYLLLVFGSVLLCRVLQKNKKYYYQKKHFVSVSTMAYRMRRNGTGLASICILATMVLVMMSTTVSLYAGTEGLLQNNYRRDVNISIADAGSDTKGRFPTEIENCREKTTALLAKQQLKESRSFSYSLFYSEGVLQDGIFQTQSNFNGDLLSSEKNQTQAAVFLLSLSEYNKMMQRDETLAENEALIYSCKKEYPYSTLQIVSSFLPEGSKVMKVKKTTDFLPDLSSNALIYNAYYVIVPDSGNLLGHENQWVCSFDLSGSDAEEKAFCKELKKNLPQTATVKSKADGKETYYQLFGGLLFLGILLSIVFLLAAVLIIYYKQIAEGYEDQARFDIMQKVGMTKQEIRSNINSQILTVFFLPLGLAGIHLCFSFPIIKKMMMLFAMDNTLLFVIATLSCFLLFSLVYALVYKITSNAYFHIVSQMKAGQT